MEAALNRVASLVDVTIDVDVICRRGGVSFSWTSLVILVPRWSDVAGIYFSGAVMFR